MPDAFPRRHGLRRILTAALLIAALTVAGAIGLFAYAAAGIDKVEADREAELVDLRLKRMLEKTLEDVQSASIWNDAVVAMNQNDRDWMQVNFGDYYADYMGHSTTLVFGVDGKPTQASRDSEPVSLTQESALIRAVQPLVAELRRAHPAGYGFDAARGRSAIVHAGGRTFLLAASTVAPEDEAVERPARDAVVVSAHDVSALVASLSADLALTAPDFVAVVPAGKIGRPLVTDSGHVVGQLVWTPDRPGAAVLRQAAPIMALLMLALAGAGLVLWIWLGRVARRLDAHRVELAQARDRAEAANEAKTRFLTNMSHELRTPLNGVLGMAEVMANGELSPLQRTHLSILKASGQELLTLIEHILMVTRLERGEIETRTEAFDLDDLVGRLAEGAAARLRSRPIKVEARHGAPGLWMGDAEHLGQALAYLIANAEAFTEEGSITLTSQETADGVRITVADTGCGIAPNHLDTLFDNFMQADDSMTRAHEGVGLGLPNCRRLVALMGGTIDVASVVGEGSAFAIVLPLGKADERLAAAA